MRKTQKVIALASLILASCSPSEEPIATSAQVEVLYLELLARPSTWDQAEPSLAARWNISHLPMIMEIQRFNRDRKLSQDLFDFIGKHTKQPFDRDSKRWQNWLWSQDYTPSKDYPRFKSALYKSIDPRFADYFANEREATIRLDEIVWGGVLQDGIPPLRDPKMISADKAAYLGNDDIVFGIEVAGEARAYPKRILAWHEMFTDTIQGVPLAGVY